MLFGVYRDVTEQNRVTAELERQRIDLKNLSIQQITSQEAERKKISKELHDEVGQSLTAIQIDLKVVKKTLGDDCPKNVIKRLDESIDINNQILEQIRKISLALRLSMLDELGLKSTLKWYINSFAERMDIVVSYDVKNLEKSINPEIEISLYRSVQEALPNVARHAEASQVDIHIEQDASLITLEITDNGKGFDKKKAGVLTGMEKGIGLLGIKERVTALGGKLIVESETGQGTHLRVEIPST